MAYRLRPENIRRVPTLRDVAVEAGVSVMTVSNVINGKFSSMSESTRERIERAVARLGYRPRVAARGLRLSRNFSVGMIIADESDHFLADPFTSHLVAGLSNALSEIGVGTMVHRIDPVDYRKSFMMQSLSTDAVCVLTAGPKPVRRQILRDLLPLRVPTIVFQENQPVEGFPATRIVMDDRSGAERIGALVAKGGVRRALILTKSNTRPALEERERGFVAGLRTGKERVQVSVLKCGQGTLPEIDRQIIPCLDGRRPADVVLACNDQMALAAIQVLARKGIRVPEDMKVAGFNGFEFAQLAAPRLTTFRAPAYEMGEMAAKLLMDHLEKGIRLPELITVPGQLAAGETT